MAAQRGRGEQRRTAQNGPHAPGWSELTGGRETDRRRVTDEEGR